MPGFIHCPPGHTEGMHTPAGFKKQFQNCTWRQIVPSFISKCVCLGLCCLLLTLINTAVAQQSASANTAVETIKELNNQAARLNSDSTNQALTYAHEAYLLAIKGNEKRWQAVSLLNLSEGYLYNDSYDQALQYAYSALDIFQALKSTPDIASCYTMLGWIFYDTENPSLSMSYHRQANKLYLSLGDEKKTALSFNAIGLVFQMMNASDSARYYFKKTLALARKNGINNAVSAALNNIGICENALGNYQEAISFFRQAMTIEATLGNELAQAETRNQLAYSYLKIKNYAEADSLLTSSRALIDASTSNTRKEKLLDNLHTSAQLYQATGNYKKAFENLKEYTEISNEIASRNKTEVVAAQHLKREMQEREKKINELNAQKELRLFQRNALAAGIVLLIIIGFLLYSKLRHRQIKEKELEAMKQLMMQRELESTMREKESLNQKLDYKNSSLKNYALYISHNNELLRDFIKELSGLSAKIETKKEVQAEYNKLIRKFLQSLEANKEKQGFNLSFDETHSDFFYNLLQRFPDLTENEQRLCAQIRLNLSSKEIASFNNISVKSVEMARYRLRKHFQLHQKADLSEFLRAF